MSDGVTAAISATAFMLTFCVISGSLGSRCGGYNQEQEDARGHRESFITEDIGDGDNGGGDGVDCEGVKGDG